MSSVDELAQALKALHLIATLVEDWQFEEESGHSVLLRYAVRTAKETYERVTRTNI